MLFRKTISLCCENHTKNINALCGQNAEFQCVTVGGTYSKLWALKHWPFETRSTSKKYFLPLLWSPLIVLSYYPLFSFTVSSFILYITSSSFSSSFSFLYYPLLSFTAFLFPAPCSFWLGLLINPKEGGDMFLRNVSWLWNIAYGAPIDVRE
jgi:hypothetical protein